MYKKFYKHPYKGKYKFIKKWFDDREGTDFEHQVDVWLSQFDEVEKDFLLECLKRYSYFRAAEYKYGIKYVFYKFNNDNKDWENRTFIFKMQKEESRVSNSDDFFVNFWKINDLKGFCKHDIRCYERYFDLFKMVTFVDDYIGSANTIISYLDKLYEQFPKLKEKPLHIMCLYLTKSGQLALNSYAIDNNIELYFYYYKTGDKFFKEGNYYSKQALIEKIALYDTLWAKKFNNENHKFGYENIQSLVSINRDTPNDTLGIFWKGNSNYKSLFDRCFEETTGLNEMIKNRKLQEKAKKTRLWKDNIDSYQNLLFVGYCARKKTTFDFRDACRRFNLTPEQLNIKLDYVLDKEYIEVKNSRFVETEKFWAQIKKRKYKDYFEDFINEVIEEKNLDIRNTNYLPCDFEEKFQGYSKKGG